MYGLIDEFCSGKKKLNDEYYEETGHLKPYSRLLDLTTSSSGATPYTTNLFQYTTIASICGLFFLVHPRIISTSTLNFKSILTFPSYFFLAMTIAICIDYVVGKKLYNFHMTLKLPIKVITREILDEAFMVISPSEGIKEYRSLLNIQNIQSVKTTIKQPDPHYRYTNDSAIEINTLTFKLKDEKIDTYLSNDYLSRDKLRSLPTPTGVISFDVTWDKTTIVALAKNGSLHKLELQSRKSLYEIMNDKHRKDFEEVFNNLDC